jgi:putative FmdB family regulatory protein
MPLYEYLCESCGRTVEVLESFSGKRISVCDRCGGRLKRLISAPSVQFKGSGWYVSDYGRSSSPPKAPEGGKVESDGAKEAAGSGGASKEASTEESLKKDSSKNESSKNESSKNDSSKNDSSKKNSSRKNS